VPLIEPHAVRLFATVRSQLTAFETEVVGRLGLEIVDPEAVARDPRLAARGLVATLPTDAPVWLHFDVDAIDSTDLPVADFHQLNGGLPFDSVQAALEVLLGAPAVAGMSVSQFNPDHADAHGEDAQRFVRGLVSALAAGFPS
jgi:arginase